MDSEIPSWVMAALQVVGVTDNDPDGTLYAEREMKLKLGLILCEVCNLSLQSGWCEDHTDAYIFNSVDETTTCLICLRVKHKYHGPKSLKIDLICKGKYCDRIHINKLDEYFPITSYNELKFFHTGVRIHNNEPFSDKIGEE